MINKELRKVVDYYKRYYQKINKVDNYRLKLSDSQASLVRNFITDFKKSNDINEIGDDILRKYFDWQFNFWYKKSSNKFGNKSIQLNWVIGKKALERWESRTQKQKNKTDYITNKGFKKDVKIELLNFNIDKNQFIKINDIEEFDKKRLLNTSNGYVYCSISTTMYNHLSTNCMECKFSKTCKTNLKINFPKIYKIRGYE